MLSRIIPLALCVCVAAPAFAQVDGLVNDSFNRANELKSAAKFDEADKEYRRCLELAVRNIGEIHTTTAQVLTAMGDLYERMGKFDHAYKAHLRSLAIRQRTQGVGHIDVAAALASVASTAMELSKFDEAEKRLSRALEIREKAKGAESKEVADTLNDLAILASRQGKSEEAVKLNRKSLSIREKTDGADSGGVAQSLSNLGLALHEMEDFRGAEEAHRRALTIREKVAGNKHPTTAETMNNLALLLKDTGRFKEAEELNRKALEIREVALGPDHFRTASTVRNLAVLCAEQGRHAEAAGYFRRALSSYDRTYGQEHPAIVDTLNSLAMLEKARGRFTVAEQILQRALEMSIKVHGQNHEAVVGTLNNLVVVARALGKLSDAEKYLGQALKIREGMVGAEHELIALTLTDLASIAMERRLFAEAQRQLERVLKIREKNLGEEHPALGETLVALAAVFVESGDRKSAEAIYRRNLAIMDRAVGEEHVAYAEALSNLCSLLLDDGRPADASVGYRKVVDIYQKTLGKEHPQIADALTKHGICLRKLGKVKSARAAHERALEINKKLLGPDHPATAASLNHLACASWLDGQAPDALSYFDEQRRSARRFLLREFPFLTDSEQREFLAASEVDYIARALAFAFANRQDTDVARRSAEWILNAKGAPIEARTLRGRLERTLTDAETQLALAELQDLRIREATLMLHEGGPATMNARKQRAELRVRRRALEQALSTGPAATVFSPWVELDAVCKALPKDGLLVDIVRLQPVESTDKPGVAPERYVAWVIAPSGRVAIVDLGECASLDVLVNTAHTAMLDAPNRIREVGEAKAEREARIALAAVPGRVISPIRAQLEGVKSLTISPDSNLWQVPWSALPLDDGKYLVETMVTQLVTSGRELVRPPTVKVESSMAMILDDPDPTTSPGVRMPQLAGMEAVGKLGGYDVTFVFEPAGKLVVRIPDGEVIGQGTWRQFRDGVRMETEKSIYIGKIVGGELKGERRFKDQSTGAANQFVANLGAEAGGAAIEKTPVRMQPVARTKSNDDAMAERLKRMTGMSVKIANRSQATEALVKLNPRPKALVLNGPGFGLPAPKMPPNFEDSYARHGLLLAGCDRKADPDANLEDGMLSGWEIANLDCRGTQVVALGDCDPALADETVIHLRRAFHVAGARAVVSALWPPDAELVNRFYIRLEIGAPAALALAEVQRNAIDERRKADSAAHPYFWAAPVVSGK